MNKKIKIVIFILVFIVLISLLIIGFCFLEEKDINIEQMTNKELIHYADKMINSEDFESKEKIYRELLENRKIEDNEFLEAKSDISNNKIAYISDYFVSLLATENYDAFNNAFAKFYNELDDDDYLNVLEKVLLVMNFFTVFDNEKYEETYYFLYDTLIDFSGNSNQKNLDSMSFLYVYSTTLNKNSDYPIIKEKLLFYIAETQVNYEDYISKIRLQYVGPFLRIKKYDSFKNSFSILYSEDEKYNTLEILNILNSSKLDVEQLTVLRQSLQDLLNNSSGGVTERYMLIDSTIKVVDSYIEIG